MKLPRVAGLAAGFIAILVWAGCGDTYRPVVNPIVPPAGTPQATRFAMAVFQADPSSNCPTTGSVTLNNGSIITCLGATEQIDVSGDTNSAIVYVGHTSSGSQAVLSTDGFVSNPLDNSVSEFALSSPGVASTAITMPSGSINPTSMVAANGQVYVISSGSNTVNVISTSTNSILATLTPPGTTPTINASTTPTAIPVALAATPDATKVYVPYSDGTVLVISTADNTVSDIPAPSNATGAPIAVLSNSSSTAVYVTYAATTADAEGNTPPGVFVINTFTAAFLVTSSTNSTPIFYSLPVGGNPGSMAFDPNLQRLYVTNPGTGSVSVFDASSVSPVTLTQMGAITGLSDMTAAASAAGASTLNTIAISTDGSTVYVVGGLSGACAGTIAAINTSSIPASSSGTVTPTTCIPSTLYDGSPTPTPLGIATAGNGTRLYMTHNENIANGVKTVDAGITIIDTTTNTAVAEIAAPVPDSSTCVPGGSPGCAETRMHPVYVMSE